MKHGYTKVLDFGPALVLYIYAIRITIHIVSIRIRNKVRELYSIKLTFCLIKLRHYFYIISLHRSHDYHSVVLLHMITGKFASYPCHSLPDYFRLSMNCIVSFLTASCPSKQFGTHLGLLGPSWRYGYFWLHIWAGRGSEPVRRRCPETPPKVRAIHGAISGGPNSELIKALKKVCPPPPLNRWQLLLFSTVKPLNTADLGTGEKAAVFRKRRYWESYITYKSIFGT